MFSDSDSDDYLHEQLGWARRNPRLFNYERNHQSFSIIQRRVSECEKELISPKDEDRLFNKINTYLKNPSVLLGINTLKKLAYIPLTVSFGRLKKMATVICQNVFNPLSVGTDNYILEYADFCKGFAYLETRISQGVTITFEDILITAFLNELSKKFNYVLRLNNLLQNRDIPLEKKQKWLEKQIEEQKRVFKMITKKSINFLDEMFQLYPEIVYRVIEFLLQCQEEGGFQYLCDLLLTVRFRNDLEQSSVTRMYEMKLNYWETFRYNDFMREIQAPMPTEKKNLTALIEHITILANRNYRVTANMNETLHNRMIRGHPMKESCPEDYIKYSIELCISSEKTIPEDDFNIDEEDGYDLFIYTLRSKVFSPYSRGQMHLWRGLKVKKLIRSY